jgi:glycosyltransferase involved in cell wall biosynthesis
MWPSKTRLADVNENLSWRSRRGEDDCNGWICGLTGLDDEMSRLTNQRKTVLFYDSVSSRPYSQDDFTRAEAGLGGTEMTVVRVAERLGEQHDVWVAQSRRQTPTTTENVRYVEPAAVHGFTPDAVVVVRNPLPLIDLRSRFPKARLFLWVQDWIFPPRSFVSRVIRRYFQYRAVKLLTRTNTAVIAVSQAHRDHLRQLIHRTFPGNLFSRSIQSHYIYNPVCIASTAGDGDIEATVDINKLIYFSAPFKGLHRVLKVFDQVSRHFPAMKLYVAMPPYAVLNVEMEQAVRAPNIVHLGRMDHDAVIQHVRTSLCCFYPADVWPESFGLVFAESNAVGTPVLAHPFGSAPEVLTAEQLCDAHDINGIIQRLQRWREPGQRPQLSLRPEFTLDSVVAQWERLLFPPHPSADP